MSEHRAAPVDTRAHSGVPRAVRVAKRCVDVAAALTGFLLAGWLFPLIALAIRLDSPGPIFYRQRRASGIRGGPGSRRREFEEFDMIKFRSMCTDAERRTGPILARERDPRVTRVGAFLRRTRLDELPQLWNVLRGDMSLVGPRPERPELFSQLMAAIPCFEERTRDVKPGITGLAQVSLGYSGRALPGTRIFEYEQQLVNPFGLEAARGAPADDMRVKLLYDLAYVAALEHMSTFVKTELYVIFKTPWVMLRGIGR